VLKTRWIRWFSDVGMADVSVVGGKNASLGEMIRELGLLGIRVPGGYALTADAYRYFLKANDLETPIREAMAGLDRGNVEDLRRISRSIQNSVIGAEFPEEIETEILRCYQELSTFYDEDFTDVAVRSSATAEALPTASFAGQQESFLNVHGDAQLLESVKKCFGSLFTPRAKATARTWASTTSRLPSLSACRRWSARIWPPPV
jgi:pyruvate,water dikinase